MVQWLDLAWFESKHLRPVIIAPVSHQKEVYFIKTLFYQG